MNDLSDEAAREYYKNAELGISEETICVSMWREANRRAEAMLEQEKKKLEAVLNLREVVRDALLKEFEERERKAFEFAWMKRGSACYPTPMDFEFDCAWEAYQAAQEKAQ
jgi:hypothetical protein